MGLETPTNGIYICLVDTYLVFEFKTDIFFEGFMVTVMLSSSYHDLNNDFGVKTQNVGQNRNFDQTRNLGEKSKFSVKIRNFGQNLIFFG